MKKIILTLVLAAATVINVCAMSTVSYTHLTLPTICSV